jgi:hypothetical protein
MEMAIYGYEGESGHGLQHHMQRERKANENVKRSNALHPKPRIALKIIVCDSKMIVSPAILDVSPCT